MPFASLVRRRSSAGAALVVAAFAAVAGVRTIGRAMARPPGAALVTVGAGGAADTLSRNLSNGFSQFANGQPLIVENRPGAGGTIAAAAVAREKPDGYTLFLAEVGPNAVSHVLGAKLPYDPHTAFTPIIHVANLPAVDADPAGHCPTRRWPNSSPPRSSSPASSTMHRRVSATGRICSWPISTARPGSIRSTSSIVPARKC